MRRRDRTRPRTASHRLRRQGRPRPPGATRSRRPRGSDSSPDTSSRRSSRAARRCSCRAESRRAPSRREPPHQESYSARLLHSWRLFEVTSRLASSAGRIRSQSCSRSAGTINSRASSRPSKARDVPRVCAVIPRCDRRRLRRSRGMARKPASWLPCGLHVRG
jgi:hypothetical protein